MSFQAGILRLDNKTVDSELLSTMSGHVCEFGLGRESTYLQKSIGLLYRPFHTTYESRSEYQPFVSQDGRVMTWDGRLDNRDELIGELEGCSQSDPDVVIVAAGLHRWSERFLSRIVGDWALVVWNPKPELLLLARDIAGIRPLFYRQQDNSILWSSELGSLVVSRRGFRISDEYVAGYLTMWPNADLTPYREVHSIPPGRFIRVRERILSLNTYWNFDHGSTIRYKRDSDYEEHFRFLFQQSIRRRLRADGPVLAELSGGLDSSSIVCVADDIIAKQEATAPRLDTFSYCDRSEPDEEDFLYFTKVEQQRGQTGHRAELCAQGDSIRLTYQDFVPVPGFGARQEIQTALNQVVRRGGYKVLLSGVGGDELLGQAFDPRVQMADLLVQARVIALFKQVASWSVLMRRPWYRLLGEIISLLLPAVLRAKFSDQNQLPWINRDFYRQLEFGYRLLPVVEGRWHWLPSRRDSLQTFVSLGRQATYRRAFIAERRCPYLDQNLVEFLSRIPIEQLVKPGDRRSLMRRSLKGFVPQEILTRRTKSSEGRCYPLTLEKHWSEIEELCKSLVVAELGYINRDEFRRSLLAMKRGHLSPHYVRLLRALSLEIWLRDMISRGVISPPGEKAQFSRDECLREYQTVS